MFCYNKVIENCKQYRSPLSVDNLVIIANPFIGLSTKISDMHYLLTAIYPPVKFEICSFYTF